MNENQMVFALALVVVLGVVLYALVSRVCACIETQMDREESTDDRTTKTAMQDMIDRGILGDKMMWFSSYPVKPEDEGENDSEPEESHGFFVPEEGK